MAAKRELYIDEATHTYTLYIHDLNAFDVGEIMVRAENELGVTMCSSVLELEILDGKIVEPRFIRQPPERIELQPGDSAQLECEVESEPPVTFKWYLNGLQLDQSNKRFRVLEDVNRTTLIIPSVQQDILPSEVTIEAAGQTGTKIVTSSILVMTAKTDDLSVPEPPELRFSRQLPSNLAYSEMDDTIILDVEVDKPEISSIELPKPTFSWYMNGIDIFLLPPDKKPERYNVSQDNPWHSRLTINKPGTWDFGEITCFVTRLTDKKEEKIYTSCNLELTYQPIKPDEQSKPIISKLEFAPQFIQGLPEKLTPEVGSTVVMDIILKSNPIPDIQWVISSPLTAERFEYFGPEQIDDETLQYRAILHNYQPDKDDNTMLQMIATTSLGQSTSICHIQPIEQQIVNIQFAKTLNSQLEVVLDQSIELECSIIPTNIPIEFRWFIKGVEITAEHIPYEINTTDFTSILKIPKINSELIGSTISVSVCSPYTNELKSSCELYTISESNLPIIEDIITELPTIPEMLTIESKIIEQEYEFSFIKPIHYELYQKSNEEYTLELECQLITDQQPASIKWSHEGTELNISDRIEQVYEYESGLAILIIHNITPQDMGEYTCTATQAHLQPSQVEPIQKTISTSTVVDIEVPETTEVVPTVTEKVLTFLQPVTPNIHTVQDHKDLELECQIQADLKPIQVVWEVDGKELTQSDRNEMIYFEDSGVARLIVHQVVPSDSGEYTCKVHGEVIEAETKQQLTKTISSGSIVTIEVPETTEVVPTVTEKVLTFLQPVTPNIHTVQDHKDLELECQIQADLKPIQVVWEVDGKELTQSDRNEMIYFEDSGVARLIVHQVVPSDSGEYTCKVHGEVIEAETKQQLTKTISSGSIVTIEAAEKKEDKLMSPIFVHELTPLNISEGEEIYLTATVKGNPQPEEVIWKHNGNILQPDVTDVVMFYTPETGVCELTISEAFPEDSGIYSVQVQNTVGMAVSQTEVLVLVEVRNEPTILKSEDQKESIVEDVLNVVTDISGDKTVVSTVEGVELPKQEVVVNIVQTETTEMYSMIETLPEIPQAAIYEHIIEETEFEISLEEPLEISDDELLLDEGVTPTHVVVLDVLIPHDSVSIDETSISIEEAGKAQSIPSVTEISLHDVSLAAISDVNISEVKALDAKVTTQEEKEESNEKENRIQSIEAMSSDSKEQRKKGQSEDTKDVEVETVELVSVKEAVVDETPVESETVSVLGVTEEKSVVSATEDFAMEVEQVTLTVDDVSPRMESLTSSAEERVVSEAVPLEETVYDVYETEQVEAVTRPTTDAVASGVVSSTTPSLSDVVSVEEVPSEQVTEAGDTVTAKTAEVIVQEGKESVSQTMEWVSEGVGELEESDRQDSARVVEQPYEVSVAVSEKPTEVATPEKVSVKEAVVEKTPVESETVPVSIVSKGVVEVADMKSTVGVTEESGSVAEQETLVVEQVAESKETVTVKMEERVVQDVEKESVPETMEWVSEGVGELEESDRQDSARVVEQPSEVGVAVSETQVEMETVELVSVKEAVVDETPVESETVSVLGVTEEKSVVSATEDFAMEVEQVTLTVDDVSPRMESLTSSAEERVVSEAVPLEETVYDVYETEQVEAVTRPTTDAVASGVVSSTTPSLSDVVSVEEVPSEQVTEAGDTVTAKTAEVIVQEGKESVSQTMEWVSEGVGELEESDRQDSARVVEQPYEVSVAVSEKPTEVATPEKVSVKEAVVEKTPVESETVPVSIVSKGVVEVADMKSTVGMTEESGSVAEQETLVVEQVAESKETVTVKMEERVVQDVEKESVSETMEWVSEGVGELEESDRQDSARVVEQPSEVGVAVSETQVEMETVELVSVKEAVVDETPVESETVSVLGVTEEKSVVSATEDFAMEVEQVTLTVDDVSPRMESLTSSAEERVVSEAVPLEETVYDVYETEQVEAVTRPTTDAVASGVVSSTTPSLSDVVSVEEVPSEVKPPECSKPTAPSTPVNIKIIIIPPESPSSKSKLHITWQQPDDIPVTNFYIELKPSNSKTWQDVSADFTITEPYAILPTDNLQEFVSYEFRVIAENEAGKSVPSLPSNSIELGIPLEFIRPLTDITVSAVTNEPVILECELSRTPRDKIQWFKDGKALPSKLSSRIKVEELENGKVHRIIFSPLAEEDLGVYSVKVENLTSEARVDMKIAPTLKLSESFSDKVIMKAGEAAVFEIPFVASPKPTVTWSWRPRTRPDAELGSAQTPRFKADVVSGLTSLPVSKVKREDAGEYSVVISNELGEVTVSIELIVLDKPSVPRNLVASDNTGESVLFSWTEPEFLGLHPDVGVSDGLSYVVEMRESNQRASRSVTVTSELNTLIDKLQVNKSYVFSVAAKNDVGQSEFAETSPVSTKLEYGPPSSPVNVKAVVNPPKASIKDQTIELTWEQPTDQVSASGPVTNFYIELKPEDSTRWQDVSADFTITEPHFTLPTDKLQEFVSYEFRVTSENKAGKSKPSSPSNAVQLGIPLEFIRPLTDITVSAVTNEPVILECELSRTPRDKIQWFKDGKALPSKLSSRIKVEELENGKFHRIIFSPLAEEDLGVYSVKVENLTSEARVDMKIAPTLKLSESFSDKVIMKAGEAAVFEIPFVASPKPTVTWSWRPRTRPDAELGSAQTPRFKADVVSGLTSLPVSKVKREDAGEYSVVISNELGEVTVSIELIVLDKPSVPRNLVASDNTGESVLFSWTEPEFLGLHPDVGVSDGLSYVVEMRESNQRASRSVTVTSELNTLIDKLHVNKSYVFSVAAKNDVGQSEFAETSPVSTKLEYGPPSSPVNVKAVVNPPKASIKDQTIELMWEQPTDQVSASGPVTNFYIELKPEDSTRWQDVSADFTITEPHFTLPTDKLQEFVSYEFRVTSENKAGKSKPSSPSNAVQLGIPLEFIRPLTDITVSAVTNEPVILECELSRTPRDKIQWFKDGKALPSKLSSRIKVEELENGKVHRIIFSPLAEEDLGVYSVKVENLTSEARVDMKIAPTLKLSESFSDKVIMKAGEAAVFEIPFVASPKPTVTWSWRPRTRPDAELGSAQTPRFKADVVSGLTSLPVSKVKREDAGEYSVVISNELGEVTVSIELIVLDKPSVPRNLVASDNTGESVLFSWTEPEFLGLHPDVGVSDGLSYVVEMRESNQRASRSVTVTSELNTLIDKLQVNKSYVFSVAAKNDVGQSEFAETSPVSTKLEYGPPSSPVNVKAVVNPPKASIKDQTIELTWEQPTDQVSASGPVTNFYIELKPEDSTRWQDVSADFTITEPHFTLPTDKLQEFVSYEFRVTSENKAGKSKPSSPSNAVQLGIPLEFIRPLTDITVSAVTNEPVILECELSRTPRDKIQWFKDGKALPSKLSSRIKVEELENGKVHRIIFSPLAEEDLGVYSVKVENLTSEARVDMKIAPTLKLSESFSDKVIMKAGEAAVFEIPFVASPKPTVTWSWRPRTRPDAELGSAQTPRFKADVVSGLTSLPVSKVKREDAGEYSVVISNELGEVTVSIELIVLDKPSVPRNLVASDNTGESVLFSWTEPEFLGLHPDVGVSDGLSYVVEMRESNQRASRSVTVTSELNTLIDKLQVNKSYVFSVAAKNDVGQSEFAETSPVSTKLEYGPPSSPVNVKAVVNPPKASIKDQTIELTWEQPTDQVSASGPVTNFYIELKPEDSTRWQDVSADFTITEPHFTLPTDKLQEFVSYEFRVTSENKAGKSKPSSPSNAVQLGIPLEFIRPLTDITVSAVTNEPVILECELSRTPRDKIQWFKDGKALPSKLSSRIKVEELENGKVHRIIFSPLAEEDLGVYSVKVENLTSEARVDMKIAPTLKLSESFSDKVIMKAGEAAVFEIPFVASPKPTVTWSWRPRTRPDAELGSAQTPRFKADVVSGLTSLPVSKVKREDAGEYSVVISNELGEVTVSIELIVLDKPSVPRNLVASDNTGESVLFSWTEPEFLGLHPDVGVSDGLSYVVEMRESNQRASRSVTVTSELNTLIDKLQVNKSYVFSVAAKNDVGQSEFAETSPVSTKLEYGPPSSPVNVKAVVNPPKASIKDQTIELTWEQPTDQVSASGPVTNFYIELKPEDSTRWQDVSADFTITEPHFTLPTDKLQEFVSYEFRVTSENKAGKSKPSSPSNAVQLGIPLEFIRPLTDLTVDKVTKEPVILECELSRTPRDKVQWLKDGKPIGRLPDRVTIEELENGKIHRVKFISLMDDDLGVYSLRVEKLSSECRLDMKVPPTLRLSDSFSDRVVIKAGGAMVFEIPFTASPKPKVEWTWRQRSRPDGELGPVQSPRFKADVVSGLTSLPVSKVKREDAGDYTVVISNELGEVSVTIQMIVIDKPSVPRDLEVSENSGESVLLSWKEPEFVGLSTTPTTTDVSGAGGLLEYVVEMRESSQRAGRGVRKTSELSVRIDDLQINKSYVFSVAAKNDVGQSEFAETKPVSTKLDYGPPSSPVNVKAVVNPLKASIKDQTIELTWEQPTGQVSASGPVTNFYIELKPEDSTRWQDVSADFTITEPHFTLPTDKLQEFVSYEFRVTSENKAGKSKPSSPSNAIQLGVPLEFIRPLTDLTVDKVTNEPVILECELSRTPRDKVQWLKDGKPIGRLPDRVTIEELENGKIHRVKFISLMDDDLGVYSLRIEKLSSECRLDMKVPPTLRLSDSFSDRVIIKAGGAMVFEIPFTASPKPKVEWTWRQRSRPDGELGPVQSPRFKADVVSGLTSLPVSKVKREDAGDYTVVISNELGEVSVTIQMIVIDKPSVPRDLEVSENSGESVLLSWKEPEFVGLSTTLTTDVSVSGAGGLLEYVVEMRESSQRAGRGVRKTSELSVRIDDLQINKSYVFSVAAKNDVGQSEFAETKPVSTKLDYGPPLSPVNVKAVVNPPKASIKDQTIELTWEQPTDQVSASGPVTNFYIELKPEDSTRWQDVSADFTITEPHFTLPTDKLQEFVSYEFRVTSENKAGKSKPSSPSNAVQLGIPLEFVRPLIDVTVSEVDGKPVVLECELSRSSRDKVQWLKDGKSLSRLPNHVSVEESRDNKIHSIKFSSLTDDDLGVYTIKVEKLSSEAKLSMKVPPTLRLSDSFSDRVIIKAGGAMVFEIPFTASPKPKVEWTWRQRSRPDGELGPVQSPRFKADVVSGLTSLPVSKVKREDAGDYTVVISNELGEVSVTIQMIVIDKPSVPRDLEVSENSGESVLLSWKEPEFVGLSTTTTTDVSVSGAGGLLEYVVEMRESSQRAGRGVRKTSELSVRIDDLQINKSYVFSVAAKNDVGQSEFAETKPVSTKLDYGPPTPPLNVTASVSPSCAEPEDQMITVSWSESETAPTTTSTGSSPLYYTVEYRVDEGRVWNKLICGKEVTGMKLDFPPLKENLSAGKSYDFRVIAVNKAGASEPSKPSNSIQLGIVLEFIRQLEDLIITNIEPIEYKLECELSRKPRTMTAWTKDNKPLIIKSDDTHMKFIDQGTIQSIHFTHLIDTDIGDYAIQVENISSKCKLEIKAPPTIRISDQFEDHITLKAGTSKILEIPFISSPKPKIKWTWAPSTDLTQEQPPRFKPDIVAGLTTLPLSRVKREDSGAYKVKISNDLGEIFITIHVIVIDKPSPPRNLTITDATEKSVMFNWDLPVSVNENESLEYVVNYRDATKYSSQPINVCVTKELKTFIDGLKLGSQYIFSVCARNEVGDSAFAESQTFLMKYSFNPPEAPGIPQVSIIESGHVSLEWTPPSSDGGSPITEYFIESMDERPIVKGQRRTSTYGSRTQWNSLTTGIIFEPNVQPKASVTGLSPDKQYTFRVCAVNKAGKGPFSPPSESCLPLMKPPKVPGKPGPITVEPLNETSVNLSWTPGTVNEDFGPADYYIIEACEDDGNEWKEVGKTTKPDDCNLNVNNLDSSTRYQFRVRGVNKEGVGEPSKPSERICLKKDAPLVITKELESIHLNEIPQTIEYECHLSKLPQKVQWFYNNKRLDTSNLRKYRFIDDGKIQKLEVLKITLDDVGEYSIKIDKLESKATFEIDLPPKLCLPDDFSDTIILTQGNNRNIEIPFTSCPPATSIVWYWNGSRTLPDPTKRTVPDNDSKSQAVLRLTAVQVSDAGIYEAIITNLYGEAKATITLKVLGVPGPVTSLEAHVESPTEVSVLWKPPEDDGGSPLTGYKVEQRQLAPEPGGVLRSQAKEWKSIANVSSKSKTSNEEEPFVHRITGLTEGATYLFGVSAVNDCGSGPRKEISDGLIMKSPYDIPEIPKQLTAKPLNHSTIELEFKLPVTHVEAPLTSVIVEYRPKSVSRWKTQTFEPCSIVQIDKLEANTEYEFRVSCTNLAGKSESSNPVKAKTKQLPKPPDTPKLDSVTPVNTNSVKVNWFSPTNDGDSPITSYQIEMCDAKNGTEVWKPIDALNIDRVDQSLLSPDEQKSYELIVKNLDNSKSFKFRVIAVNSIGPGKPSRSSQPVTPGIEVNIIRPLNNVCFDEIPKSGTKVELECELSQSNCRVNWLYNGKPIVLGKKYDFSPEGNVYRLIINDITLEDMGVYELNYKKLKTQCKVEAKIPPTLLEDTEESHTRRINVGSNCVFEVPFKAYPKPTIKWLAQNIPITDKTKRYQVNIVAGLTSLSIQRVQKDDTGQLAVIIENEHGKLTWKCELIVIDKPKPVENLTVESSIDQLHMIMNWKPPRKDLNNPITHYELEYRNSKNRSWQTFKNGSSDVDDLYKIPNNLTTFEIKITEKETANSLASNTDYYFRIIVVNEVGKSEPTETRSFIKTPSLPTSLEDGSEAPHFLKELTSITVVEGSAARFETCARGQPAPTVRWLKDGKPLLTDGIRLCVSQTSTERSGTNTSSHTLLVKDAIPRDSGTYTCIATSSSGTAITEAALHVRGLFGRGGYIGSDTVNSGGIRHRHPEFTRRLRNQQVDFGSTIRLAASVLAQPSATVVWQKDGIEILTDPSDDPRITAKNHSGHLELRIENVCKDDLGQYTVIVYNSAGEARCSCILQSTTKMEIQVPKFTKELRDYTILEGTNLCLETIAIGEPIPEFKWEKDGFEILPDEYGPPRITPGTNGSGLAYLRIHNVRSSDAGLYRCIAYNRFGRERTTCIVHVESIKQKGVHRSDMRNGSFTSKKDTDSSLALLSENGIKASPKDHSDSPKLTGYITVLRPLPKTIEVEEGSPIELTCRVDTNLHYIPTWSKSGRTLTYDGRRRITRSKDGELTLAIDQVMSNDDGSYTLTLEASDANAPKNLEPIVLSTRVQIKSKQKPRYDTVSRGSSRANSRATSVSNGRTSKEP
ncbi:unnamed protein product [Schistosoma margrebowiei]|nr:unnamed protein product [Schistosoma margrebowiei]